MDSVVDSQGRHYRLRRITKFDDHKDASERRNGKLPALQSASDLLIPFPETRLVTSSEIEFFEVAAQLLTKTTIYCGTLQVYHRCVVFEAQNGVKLGLGTSIECTKVLDIEIAQILLVLKRSFFNQDVSCDLFQYLKRYKILVQFGSPSEFLEELQIVKQWQSAQISNYEYLYWLNIISGHSFNDLSPYPIFPRVLTARFDFPRPSRSDDLRPFALRHELRRPD
jgi:hypothetical protein